MGAVAGALALTVLSEALRVFQGFRLIIYGGILIFTVIFMPEGLAGFFAALRERVMPREKGVSHDEG